MKRRELLSLATLGAIPMVFNKSLAGTIKFYEGIGIDKNSKSNQSIPRFGDGRDWFFEKRFGMFVHWGIYCIPAWHEQYQWRASVPRSEYVKFADQFNPKKFNPAQWLDLMQEAGMEYITFTTKHHDGFCMWNSNIQTIISRIRPLKKIYWECFRMS